MESAICSTTASFKDQQGYEQYHTCGHKVYCVANYRVGTTGKFVTKNFCKKHFNALVKNCESVKKRTGWNAELTFELI